MPMLIINNVTMPEPSSYALQYSDLDGAGTTRSINGVLHRDRIRANIAKIQVEWNNIKQSDVQTICNAVSGASFTVQYFDGTSTLQTMTAYAGDKDLTLVAMNANNSLDNRWNLKFNLVQF